jgi:hypothetical protein
MSDIDPSGAETTAAVTASAPSVPPPPAIIPSAFSNNRGSGLARGKRPVSPSTQAASAAPAADYKPTAVSILTAPTEYKNPFAPTAPPAEAVAPEASTPEPAMTPLPAAPADEAAPAQAPAAVADGVIAAAVTDEIPTVPAQTTASDRPASDGPQNTDLAENAPKPELKILPPETPRRVEQSWESKSFGDVAGQPGAGAARPEEGRPAGPRPYREDRRGERPYYRPDRERRENRPGEFREPRPGSEAQGRPSDNYRGQPEPAPAPAHEEPKKAGGVFGWVKKLFGSSPAEAPKPETPRPDTSGQREFTHDGPYHRRRRRGGRGHNFQGDQRGPHEGQSGGQPSGDQRGYGGDQRQHGRHRHHHHGGGGFRGNGRPEGGPPPAGS